MGRISWAKAAEISAKMKWCKKCAFEPLRENEGPCAFCRPRPQITPTHYKRRRI